MITTLWDLEQGSEEWRDLRKTKISATDAYDLLNGMSISDILQRKQESNFTGSYYTQRGHELEETARQIYQETFDEEVKTAGAILNDKYPNALCSPDGIIPDGLIEIKSFTHKHHKELAENSDAHVLAQIQFQLLISERKFVKLVQYNPDEEDFDKVFIVKKILPDPEIQEKLKKLLVQTSDNSLEDKALTITKLEQEVLAYESQFAEQLSDYQSKKAQLEELKQELKTQTTGKISKTYTDDLGNTLGISIYDRHSIQVSDPSKVQDEYTSLEEIEDAFVQNGKIYRKTPNTKLVQNQVKLGKSLPEGFIDKTSRTISIKFNGKAI